ncbi:tetratricopeptide repeat protein [Ktedonobacter racemifer]|uniref:NB-ARC domain protein n=1 Tax=Ktedonobacter racemifer DSM 44963 TaxID=485913 RepID=D6TLZ0_KTERA|nr:tetratricopeptide repeat protein [Ktedonobacter racemifer]EFH86790.1 NB-ARC domain protein [Ktedonobacter racemifer DSM 44963]
MQHNTSKAQMHSPQASSRLHRLSSVPTRPLPIFDPAIPRQPGSPLIGRANDLELLKQHLWEDGNASLTTLNGLPGIGKTTLAITLAYDEEVLESFADGILWAGLGPSANIPSILSHWGRLLGLSLTEQSADYTSWTRALHAAIGSRRLLIIIDDAWTLEDVLPFKIGGPHCAHLVTTRFPAIAAHFAVNGPLTLPELNKEESMRLLRHLAPTVFRHDSHKESDLVQAVGGLPLALTLMGNYLRKQASHGDTQHIQNAIQSLSNTRQRLELSEAYDANLEPEPGAPKLRSLQSVIAITDRQLSSTARAALCALSILPPKPHSFSEETALTVADCDPATLDVLIDAGLLECSMSERYTLHQTISDYARAHLEESAPYARFIAYILDYVEQHEKDYELLEGESAVILGALDAAYEHQYWAELVKGVCAFAPFLLMRGSYALAHTHLQRAYQAANILQDRDGILNTLLQIGEIAYRLGEYTLAHSTYQQGIELARSWNNRRYLCAHLTGQGWLVWKRSDYSSAESYLREGLTIAQQDNYPEYLIEQLRVLGSIIASGGDYNRSEVYLQEALSLARTQGDREKVSRLYLSIGVTYAEQGQNEKAEHFLNEGLSLARQIVHCELTIIFLLNLGTLAYEQEHYELAETHLQEGLGLAQHFHLREWIGILLINIGEMKIKQGTYTQAEDFLVRGLKVAKEIGSPRIIASAHNLYGELYLHLDQVEQASAAYQHMLTTLPEGDHEMYILGQYGLARVAAARGDITEARRLGDICLASLVMSGHRKEAEVRTWLASLSMPSNPL